MRAATATGGFQCRGERLSCSGSPFLIYLVFMKHHIARVSLTLCCFTAIFSPGALLHRQSSIMNLEALEMVKRSPLRNLVQRIPNPSNWTQVSADPSSSIFAFRFWCLIGSKNSQNVAILQSSLLNSIANSGKGFFQGIPSCSSKRRDLRDALIRLKEKF